VAIPISHCRVCQSGNLEPILSLGELPAVNSFLSGPEEIAQERRYPLAINLCASCGHVQLTHRLDPRDVFTEYIYFSSMSETVVRWGKELARNYIEKLSLSPPDLVAELASNDGCILKPFQTHSRVIGIEPARNIAAIANQAGIETIAQFFDSKLARELRVQYGPARLVIARNVLAHVPDLQDFLSGVAHWLTDDGVLHVEVPYLGEMVERVEFDTIYHEHLSYFSVRPLQLLFSTAGLVLTNVEEIPLHGGSLIVSGRKIGQPNAEVDRYLAREKEQGLSTPRRLEQFADATLGLKDAIPSFLRKLAGGGRRIAAYGAAAKGVVLTNYCGIGPELLDFVADRSPYKQKKLMPGTHLQVVPAERVFEEQPDFLLVLAWNFFSEIGRQLAAYQERGGQFVIPIPFPRVEVA
jgi:hypothetical protein